MRRDLLSFLLLSPAIGEAASESPAVATAPGQAPPPARETSTDSSVGDSGETRTRKSKPAFPVPEGGLTEVPTDYDPEKYRSLKKSDFAKPTVFMRYKADLIDAEITALTETRDDLRTKADRYEKLGNEETIKRVEGLDKMRKEAQKLKDQLIKQFVESGKSQEEAEKEVAQMVGSVLS